MKSTTKTENDSDSRNRLIKQTYLQINKAAKALLTNLPQESLRHILERDFEEGDAIGIIHELVSPLLYLRLERHEDDALSIHYGYCQTEFAAGFYAITSAFIRIVYKLTMASLGAINIENCVRTDYVITECAELYEHLVGRDVPHRRCVLKCKPTTAKRKQLLSVA